MRFAPYPARALLFALFTSSVAVESALAREAVWIGGLDYWTNTVTWSTGAVPDASTDVFIRSGSVILLDAPPAAPKSITVSGAGSLLFMGLSNADNLVITATDSTTVGTGIRFSANSSAGNARLAVNGSGRDAPGGIVVTFIDNSTAGAAVISLSNLALAMFVDGSTAGNARIVSSGGRVGFYAASNAGAAHITNSNQGLIAFSQNASADGATIVNRAGGMVDVSGRSRALAGDDTSVVIGSLSGSGDIYLGTAGVSLGALNQNDVIAGGIHDGYSPILRQDALATGLQLPQLVGGGHLEKVGAGTLILTGNNTYTGSTVIAGGTLQLGDGGTSGSLLGDIRNNAVLAINRAGTLTLEGAISGSGVLRQIGPGRVELKGNSSAYTGATSVEAGTLVINGALGGTLEIANAGTLQGAGSVGSTVIKGSVAPGNSIGTLTVNGDVTFQPGSVYAVELNAAGQSDMLHATGASIINGGTVSVTGISDISGIKLNTDYRILTADGGRAGAFSGLSAPTYTFVNPSLRYDPNNVYLTFTRNGTAFASVGDSANQARTAQGLESVGAGAVYNTVLTLSANQARSAFDLLSGEVHASVASSLLEDSRFIRSAMNDRLRGLGESALATQFERVTLAQGYGSHASALPSANRQGAWASTFGSWGRNDSDGNAASITRDIGGFLLGVDHAINETWQVGMLAGYSGASYKVDGRRSSASSDNYHFGAYGGGQWGALALRFGLAYTWSDIASRRDAITGTLNDSLRADYRAGTAQAFAELGYLLNAGSAFSVEPFANLAYANARTRGFSESGGASALSVNSRSNDLTYSTLGMRSTYSFEASGRQAAVRGMLGWRHAYGDVTPKLNQAFSGGDSFTIAGVAVARDAVVVEAGLDFAISRAARLGVGYQGQLAADARDHAVKAALNIRF